jgi:putative hemolysin
MKGKSQSKTYIYSPLKAIPNAGEYEVKHWSTRAGSVNPSQVYCAYTSGIALNKASFRLH